MASVKGIEMADKIWSMDLAAQVEQVRQDMVEIAATGQYPVVMLLRGYDLLEQLGDWENVKYNVGESEDFYKALQGYRESYLVHGEQLYAVIDMEQVRMKAAAYMSPWVRRHKEARQELDKAAELWEMAKVAHKAQEEGSFWEKWSTLRRVRKMAGFRLERGRTGNFVSRTFDLMQEAQAKARQAELEMYGHNVAHKCTPDSYMKIFELVSGKYLSGEDR